MFVVVILMCLKARLQLGHLLLALFRLLGSECFGTGFDIAYMH